MSELHTKLEKEVNDLKQKVAHLEEEMDGINSVDDNRWDTMIQEFKSLNEDFVKLGNLIKKFFTPKDLEPNKEIDEFKKVCTKEALAQLKCTTCKNNIPPPINDCTKHEESGAKIGEMVKCASLTGNSLHNDYYKPKPAWKDWFLRH